MFRTTFRAVRHMYRTVMRRPLGCPITHELDCTDIACDVHWLYATSATTVSDSLNGRQHARTAYRRTPYRPLGR